MKVDSDKALKNAARSIYGEYQPVDCYNHEINHMKSISAITIFSDNDFLSYGVMTNSLIKIWNI